MCTTSGPCRARSINLHVILSNAEIKPVSQCYTKYITHRSMSITVILQQHETIISLFPTQKQNTTWTHSFRWLYDFGTNNRLRLRMPQLYLHLQVDWTSFLLFNWCFNWVILCFRNPSEYRCMFMFKLWLVNYLS